ASARCPVAPAAARMSFPRAVLSSAMRLDRRRLLICRWKLAWKVILKPLYLVRIAAHPPDEKLSGACPVVANSAGPALRTEEGAPRLLIGGESAAARFHFDCASDKNTSGAFPDRRTITEWCPDIPCTLFNTHPCIRHGL